MRKEWLLLAATVAVTLALALGGIRLLAPQLLGGDVPVDRRVVQAADEVPPFFDLVLNPADLTPDQSLINDPYVGHRRAVMVPENTEYNAPFDLLGFRNRSVPVVADVVALGDSQTVGTSTVFDQSWPRHLEQALAARQASVYNMSVGGWGAVQYLYMFDKAAMFRPRVVVVAFYTGNDPVDSLHMAYSFEPWKSLRGAPEKPKAAPLAWPPDPADTWAVRFADGVTTGFAARTRLSANDRDYPGTLEGYRIMAEVARRIDARAVELGIAVIYTIIPTKELAHAAKLRAEGIAPPPDFVRLVQHETQNIAELSAALSTLPHGRYVDVASLLQRAALGPVPLYPANENGHPLAAGYRVIALALAPHVQAQLPPPLADGVALWADPEQPGGGKVYLVRDGGARLFNSQEVFLKNGWKWQPETFRPVTLRDLAALRNLGLIETVDPAAYGPRP